MRTVDLINKIFTINGVNLFQFFRREANDLCFQIDVWSLLEPSHHRTDIVELDWNSRLIKKYVFYWKTKNKYFTIFFSSVSWKDGPPKALDCPNNICNNKGKTIHRAGINCRNIYIFQVDVYGDGIFAIFIFFAAAGAVTEVFIFRDPGFVPGSLLIVDWNLNR